MKKENADIRMVLDFYSSGKIKKEICLNYARHIFIDNNLYRSKSLFYLIENEIKFDNSLIDIAKEVGQPQIAKYLKEKYLKY